MKPTTTFTIPEEFRKKYDGLNMTLADWNKLEKIVSPSTYHWALIEYQKQCTNDLVYCDCNPCVCSYNSFNVCCLGFYCSHQIV